MAESKVDVHELYVKQMKEMGFDKASLEKVVPNNVLLKYLDRKAKKGDPIDPPGT